MNKRRRYVMSGGLAFTERGDMEKLRRLAKEGWVLDSFAFLGYYVRKTEPCDLIYSVDYHRVAADGMAEYEEMFEAGGWSKVCSSGDIHIFAARPGTKPIYTDNESRRHKYGRSEATIRPLLWVPVVTAILLILRLLLPEKAGSDLLGSIAMTLGIAGLVVSVPVLTTYIALYVRRKRIR